MAMVTAINNNTGSGPTAASVSSVVWNRVDSASGTTAIPTPTSTGTNFSFVKSLVMNITTTNSLSMTNILFGKVAAETTTGTKLWQSVAHSSYTQATAAPTSTSDNNVTAPTVNSAAATAVQLISAPPSTYAAGPFSSTGNAGNFVEVCLGIDSTNTTAGTSVATPTLEWSWTEG